MIQLYKKDTKGKIRVWKGYTDGAILHEETGLLGGKLVKHSKMCDYKNIGKANEMSPSKQASFELKAKEKKKLDEGYFRTIEEAQNVKVLLPMLAKNFHAEESKIQWETAFIQPKLDGMRCLIEISGPGEVKMISRQGKEITTLPHILNSLIEISSNVKSYGCPLILDGELYAHGESFQENMKRIKKYTPGYTEEVHFHVYDVVSTQSFINRWAIYYSLIDTLAPKYLTDVEVKATSREDINQQHAYNLSLGYEGSIVRWGDEPYAIDSRSSSLLKLKDFKDVACRIIDVVPMDARPDQGLIICSYNDKEFKATPKMSHKNRAELLINKKDYIGKTAEIRFFEFTDEGIPRFPVFVGIREDIK